METMGCLSESRCSPAGPLGAVGQAQDWVRGPSSTHSSAVNQLCDSSSSGNFCGHPYARGRVRAAPRSRVLSFPGWKEWPSWGKPTTGDSTSTSKWATPSLELPLNFPVPLGFLIPGFQVSSLRKMLQGLTNAHECPNKEEAENRCWEFQTADPKSTIGLHCAQL